MICSDFFLVSFFFWKLEELSLMEIGKVGFIIFFVFLIMVCSRWFWFLIVLFYLFVFWFVMGERNWFNKYLCVECNCRLVKLVVWFIFVVLIKLVIMVWMFFFDMVLGFLKRFILCNWILEGVNGWVVRNLLVCFFVWDIWIYICVLCCVVILV